MPPWGRVVWITPGGAQRCKTTYSREEHTALCRRLRHERREIRQSRRYPARGVVA